MRKIEIALDSDDEWLKNKLNIQLKVMKQEKIDFFYYLYYRITNKDKCYISSGK